MQSFRLHSMAGAAWKWICFASSHESRSNWTAANILATRKLTGETVARTFCFKSMAIGSSASLLKTLGRISIKFWMQFCGPYLIKPLECELLPPVGTAQKHR